MNIWQIVDLCHEKHINDPVKIASWAIHNDKYWKSKGYDYTKATVVVALDQIKRLNLDVKAMLVY